MKTMTIDDIIKEKIPFEKIPNEVLSYIKDYELFNPTQEDIKYYWKTLELALVKLKILNNDKEQKIIGTVKSSLQLNGQLWEECDRCGDEPIYMSHGVCEKCAMKGYRIY